jgi:hypothetical protein
MIEDEVIREVRTAREAYAALHGFNIRAMVADLQAQDLAGDWPVVSRPRRSPQLPNNGYHPTGPSTADSAVSSAEQ